MRGMNDFLSAAGVVPHLSQQAACIAIEAVEQTGSTNADLLARIGALAQPTLLVARTQTAGRGRAGRTWLSAPDASLTFSLAWPFERPLAALAGLPLAVGVALADGLAAMNVAAQLKWPNDILIDGAKLAGVLIEAMPDGTQRERTWAVIGIGINLALPEQLARQINRAAAHAPALARQDRHALLATLMNHLAQALQRFEREGLAPFVARWNALDAYGGQAVAITEHGAVLREGVARGIDAAGCLLLDTADGPAKILAGDVSLRAKEG